MSSDSRYLPQEHALKLLGTSYNSYEIKLKAVAEYLRDIIVQPFCEEHGILFYSSEKGWSFSQNAKNVMKTQEYLDIVDMLNLNVYGTGRILGTYMPDIIT